MNWTTTLLLSLSLAACGAAPEAAHETADAAAVEVADGADPAAAEDWRAELDEWKAKRDRGLRRPDGWLSLVGLFWLEDGDHVLGADAASDLVFPSPAAPRLGVLRRSGSEVSLRAAPEAGLTVDGKPVSSLALTSDAAGSPTVVELGSLSFYVIQRGDRIGVRLKDSASPLLAGFEGMDYYPPSPDWRIDARFELYAEPRVIRVPNILGDVSEEATPGAAVFEIDGRELRLEPTGDPAGELFFVFGDSTNGDTTYGGGRFLYAGPPAADGSLVLDFNRAYNPPCVFTPYATCPLPRPEDDLGVAIEAGEKMFGAAH